MLLTVFVSSTELEEDRRILRVGEQVQSWLTFEENGRWEYPPPSEAVRVIRGNAAPLPAWPGAEARRHPTQINVDGGALYWDAPLPVSGPIEVAGTVSTNSIDAPDSFPPTSGAVRTIRMVWQEYIVTRKGSVPTTTEPRYVEVNSTYFAPSGATEIRWTGALIELETSGSATG